MQTTPFVNFEFRVSILALCFTVILLWLLWLVVWQVLGFEASLWEGRYGPEV